MFPAPWVLQNGLIGCCHVTYAGEPSGCFSSLALEFRRLEVPAAMTGLAKGGFVSRQASNACICLRKFLNCTNGRVLGRMNCGYYLPITRQLSPRIG